MNLRDAIQRIMSDGEPTEAGRPQELVEKLRERYGSNRAAARETGIPESTLRRWGKGAKPAARSTAKVEKAARSLHLKQIDPSNFRFIVKDRPDRDGRERVRKLTPEQLQLRPGTLDRVREAHLRGDHDSAAREFMSGIGNNWYREWLTPGSKLAQTGMRDGSGGGPRGAARRIRQQQEAESAQGMRAKLYGRDDDSGEPSDLERDATEHVASVVIADATTIGEAGETFAAAVESVDVAIEIDTGYGGSIVGGESR